MSEAALLVDWVRPRLLFGRVRVEVFVNGGLAHVLTRTDAAMVPVPAGRHRVSCVLRGVRDRRTRQSWITMEAGDLHHLIVRYDRWTGGLTMRSGARAATDAYAARQR